MFPWEEVGGLWATKSEGVGLTVRAISFQDFQGHRQTDGQTQRRTPRNCNTVLCTKVHRAVKTHNEYQSTNQ